MISSRNFVNEKSENLTLDLDVGPDMLIADIRSIKEINPFIPTWISLPYLQAILSVE